MVVTPPRCLSVSKRAAHTLPAAAGFLAAFALGITSCLEKVVATGTPLGSDAFVEVDARYPDAFVPHHSRASPATQGKFLLLRCVCKFLQVDSITTHATWVVLGAISIR
jgi:hypothetical protein